MSAARLKLLEDRVDHLHKVLEVASGPSKTPSHGRVVKSWDGLRPTGDAQRHNLVAARLNLHGGQ